MIGSTIRSAKMNAITPANEIPPDHRTAASGTFPIEQTKLSTAIIGPAMTFSSVFTGPEASFRNRALKKSSPSRPMKPASRKPIVISFHSIPQSWRKFWATSDHAPTRLVAGGVVLMAVLRSPGVLACLLLDRAGDEESQRRPHQGDQHDPAEVLREGELP